MKMTDFIMLVDQFIVKYLVAARDLSPNTILSYRDSVVLLATFMSNVHGRRPGTLEITDITAERVEKFLGWLRSERTNNPSTRNIRSTAIRSLFRYLYSQRPEHIFHSQQMLSMPVKKTAQTGVTYLDAAQTGKLLAAPDITTAEGERDLALLCLLYDSEYRVQELADVRAGDIRFTAPPQVALTGKGRKTRTVPLMEKIATILKNYISCYRLDASRWADLPLFFNYRGEKLTGQGITYILQKYTEDASIGKITPYIFWHNKAVHLTEADINPVYIRDFLGHTDLKVPQIYSKANAKMKQDAIEKLARQKAPLPETDSLVKTKNWADDKDLMGWLNSLGR